MPPAMLTEVQRFPTSGARAVEAFRFGGVLRLAVPQLAYDAEGTPPGINGGSSNTDVLLFEHDGERFQPAGRLPGVGGEDVETFGISDRLFLAVASIRMGSGPYNYRVGSPIYEFVDGGFRPFQTILTSAAKQWRHFRIGDEHFLGVAQNHPGDPGSSSAVFRWDGERFEPFQEIPSRAGYNLYSFQIGTEHFLAHADHAEPSILYRWDGAGFTEHQQLVERGGRAFLLFTSGASTFLAVARIDGDSLLLRWDGTRFAEHSVLAGGAGGREFALISTDTGAYVIRVNFILGSPAQPEPDLSSFVYRVGDDGLELVADFPTTGATDATAFDHDGRRFVAVSHGLSAAAAFAAECVVYRFDGEGGFDEEGRFDEGTDR